MVFCRVSLRLVLQVIYNGALIVSSANLLWPGLVLGLSITVFSVQLLQYVALSIIGERLTRDLRLRAFSNLLNRPLSFFDENTPGKVFKAGKRFTIGGLVQLANTLAVGGAYITEVFTGYWAEAFFHLITVLTGGIVAISLGWSLALSLYALYPVASGTSDLQANALSRLGKRAKRTYRQSLRILQETIPNIRMVLALTRTEDFWQIFQGKTFNSTFCLSS